LYVNLNFILFLEYNIFSIIYIICLLVVEKELIVVAQIVNATVKKHGVNEHLKPNALRELENAETTNAIKKENKY